MRRVRAHAIEIAVDELGSGEPPFLVVPQWFLSSRSMRASALVRRLAERHRVVLYDRRGTGASDKPGPPYTTSRDSRDLGALAESLGLRDLVVLGTGVRGSQVALHFAGHFPERVRAIVCIGGTPRWGGGPEWPYGIGEDAWARAYGELEARGDDSPPRGASLAMREDWAAAGREAAMDMLRHTREEDLRPFLARVTSPTLVVHLAGDPVVPFEAARWLAESLPSGTLEVFEAPREIPLHVPEDLVAHVEEFLASLG
ncbi:MAG: alpha/beta fold hydrolase [Acidobacteria bacterium]|nr:alpha/beta fold hydrolase [Acidobacteriota bacterium]